MYFENRAQAGRVLAVELAERYRYENCVVVAISTGGVVVGEQIAAQLHCLLTMLVTESIEVPGEGVDFGALSQTGGFTYNSEFSAGEIDEYVSEFHGYLDDQKREAFSRINKLVGEGGLISQDMLRDRVVILVSDGFADVSTVEVAADYLKPIRIIKLVVTAPIATVAAVDRLHITADELHILDVKQNFMGVDHYYDDQQPPTREEAIAKINEIVLNWR